MATFADLSHLREKTVALLGYGADAREQARLLRSRGFRVIIGLREIDPAWAEAERDGFAVYNLWGAVQHGEIIQVW